MPATRIVDLMLRWEECAERGEALTPEELCRDTPELLDELRRHVAGIERMNQALDNVSHISRPGSGEGTQAEPTADVTLPPTLLTDLRPHDGGGFGELFTAHDTGLNRKVALKMIRRDQIDSQGIALRFAWEAKVTAQLDHPGIVPVHATGKYPDGRPCYVMRFIEGQSLRKSIRQFHGKPPDDRRSASVPSPQSASPHTFESLEFRRLLQRFVAICQVLAYAHNRGVIHRDIKPANAMLGNFGETLVIDWGLAKVMRSGEDAGGTGTTGGAAPLAPPADGPLTQQCAATIGTPAYMSPEQAAGRLNELGPAADIYSLGATLYELLTGQMPFPKPDLEAVKRGDFPRPRKVAPDVPRPLEAICLMAMAKNPVDRYATAEALAADIEHWLADDPVSAFQERATDRARRTIRKHPGPVMGLAATILVGLIGAGTGLYFVNAERNQTETARDQARARNRLLLNAVGLMKKEVNALNYHPENNRERSDLLEQLVPIAKEISAEGEATWEVASTTFRLRVELGDMLADLANDLESAAKYYEPAVKDMRRHARAAPDQFAVEELEGYYQFSQGNLCLYRGDYSRALAHFEGALGRRQLVPRERRDALWHRDVGRAYFLIGDALDGGGKAADAVAAFRRSRRVFERLAASPQRAPEHFHRLGLALDRLARHCDDHAGLIPAQKELERCVLDGLARHRNADANRAEAMCINKRTLDLRRWAASEYPEYNAQFRRDACYSIDQLVRLLLQHGDFIEAGKLCAEGLASRQQFARRDPGVMRYVCQSYEWQADCHLFAGALRQAMDSADKSLQLRRSMLDSKAPNPQTYYELIHVSRLITHIQLAQSAPLPLVESGWRERLDFWRCVHELNSSLGGRFGEAAADWRDFGDFLFLSGQSAEAARAYGEAKDLTAKVTDKAYRDELRADIRVRDGLRPNEGPLTHDAVLSLVDHIEDFHLLVLLQGRFDKDGDPAGLVRTCERLASFWPEFLALRAAARGFARAAQIDRGDSAPACHQRCRDLLNELALRSAEARKQLKSDPLFRPYLDELTEPPS